MTEAEPEGPRPRRGFILTALIIKFSIISKKLNTLFFILRQKGISAYLARCTHDADSPNHPSSADGALWVRYIYGDKQFERSSSDASEDVRATPKC